jgi:aryl-alcohol dehydrogenase-like predicted oxidoreductase
VENPIPKNQFGKLDRFVTRVGLGGEGILRTFGQHDQARRVIFEALKQDIEYFDSAKAYADSEVYLGSVWKENPGSRSQIFQAGKSARRDRQGALKDLENTLNRLQTPYLDLWQIHDVRTDDDIAVISASGGALEAFIEAKSEGKVKAIGVTGHHDPRILAEAITRWPVDAAMMPVNPVEGVLAKTRPYSFLTTALDAAIDKKIAVIAMKVLGAANYIHPEEGITPEILIRYALSFNISLAIVGCSSPEHVHMLSIAGKQADPMNDSEKTALESPFEPMVNRLAYYRGIL